MFVHRFHWPYYLQVSVYVWPILFFNLWRVDRWSAATGKRAFVVPDEFGFAWVPYHEGMEIRYFVHNLGETRCPEPCSSADFEPVWLAGVSDRPAHLFSADASKSWGPGTGLAPHPQGAVLPTRPACADAFGPGVWRDPGWRRRGSAVSLSSKSRLNAPYALAFRAGRAARLLTPGPIHNAM
ncbi:MAG: hypothetical protein AAF437_07545 [Pseudomonadota bacterium]